MQKLYRFIELEFSVKPMTFQFLVISNIHYNTFFLHPKCYLVIYFWQLVLKILQWILCWRRLTMLKQEGECPSFKDIMYLVQISELLSTMNKIWKEFVTCFVYRDFVDLFSKFSCLAFDLPIAKNN